MSLSVGGSGFYYSAGSFYRPYSHEYVAVPAPIGATVYTLPPVYRVVNAGPATYYYGNNAWYSWDDGRRGYVVVSPPPAGSAVSTYAAADTSVYAYPSRGQNSEQSARDKYECYLWAVDQSGFDPSRGSPEAGSQAVDYNRANSACLTGRGYSVQ